MLGVYTSTVILTKLASPALPMHCQHYEFHLDDLLNTSNQILKIAGMCYYEVTPDEQVALLGRSYVI